MTAPKVSVSIATFNRAPMVRQAIEAALAQTLPPAEICVTDDASTDDTWLVLTELAKLEPRLRIVRQSRNTGGVGNWNAAIQETTGDYIAWCSDDDRFLPDHLAVSVRFLETHPHIGLVHAGFVDAIETTAGTELQPRKARFPHDTILDRDILLTYLTRYYDWPFHPSTLVMRRSVWNAVGPFDPAYALADTDWFVRAAERFPVAMLTHHGVLNRRHPGNWSNRLGSAKMQREIFQIVTGAIHRLYPDRPLVRGAWKLIWRTNVRLRLLVTLRARAASGHTEPACAAWTQLWDATDLALPLAFRRAGERLIRWWAGRRAPVFKNARQSVSPL